MRILHADGKFSHWISPRERDDMLTLGKLRELHEEREDGPHFVGYTHEQPTKSNPNNSPCGITAADVLAAVGLSRFPGGLISEGRQSAARRKIAEHGNKPSWMYPGRLDAVELKAFCAIEGICEAHWDRLQQKVKAFRAGLCKKCWHGNELECPRLAGTYEQTDGPDYVNEHA